MSHLSGRFEVKLEILLCVCLCTLDDSGDSRMHTLSSSTGNSRTGTPISPIKRKFDDVEVGSGQEYENEQMAKMSCLISSHL